MKCAPDYGDRSPQARLFWLKQTRTVYEAEETGAHVSRAVCEHARERLPGVRAEIERIEAELRPALRVVE